MIPLKLFSDMVSSSISYHARCEEVFLQDENARKVSWDAGVSLRSLKEVSLRFADLRSLA